MHVIELAKRAPRTAKSHADAVARDSTEPVSIGDLLATNKAMVPFVLLVSQDDDCFISRRTIKSMGVTG